MKKLLTLSILLSTLLLTSIAWSQDFQKGIDAANRGDFETALREWKPLAEQGDANVQFYLGFMYANGQGVPHDYKEAFKWYRYAAEQEEASAQYRLGFMYANGQGVPQDYVLAYMWVNLASAQNSEFKEYRNIIEKRLTPSQLEEGQRLSIGKVAVQELFQHENIINTNQEVQQRIYDAIESKPELLATEAVRQEVSKISDEVLTSTITDEYKLTFSAGSYLGFYLINIRTRKEFCANHNVDITEYVNEFTNENQALYLKAKTILKNAGLNEDMLYSSALPSHKKLINLNMQEITDANQITMEEACKLFNEQASYIVSELQFSKSAPKAHKILMEY